MGTEKHKIHVTHIVDEPSTSVPDTSQKDTPKETESPVKPKTLELNITLPALREPRAIRNLKQTARNVQRKKTVATVATFIFVATTIGSYTYFKQSDTANVTQIASAQNLYGLTRGTPDYAVIKPKNKSIEELGGWTRISPPDRDPVYAYTDRIDSASISVSQQPLPDNLKGNTEEQIKQLAADFNAYDTIEAGRTTAYVGTSANGPQSIIFNKGNLLVLIKSTDTIEKAQWSEYISSLR